MAVVQFYSSEAVNGRAVQRSAKLYPQLSVTSELCYNVELTGKPKPAVRIWQFMRLHVQLSLFFFFFPSLSTCAAGGECLSAEQKEVLLWLFRPPMQTEALSEEPNLTEGSGEKLVEIGPRYCCCEGEASFKARVSNSFAQVGRTITIITLLLINNKKYFSLHCS